MEENRNKKETARREWIIERLRKEGCRITRQRELILDTILEGHCSSCKEIYYKVQEKDRQIGPATVYRMINTLEMIGAINRKNLYRISGEQKYYTVTLSDASSCTFNEKDWKRVVQCGMKQLGYIKEQDVEEINREFAG